MEEVININPHPNASATYVLFKDRGECFLFTPHEVHVAHLRAKASTVDLAIHKIVQRKRGLIHRLLSRFGLNS